MGFYKGATMGQNKKIYMDKAKNYKKEPITFGEDRLIRIGEVCEICGFSTATQWRLQKSGEFPKKVRVSKGIVAWKLKEVINFLETRERK